MTYDLISFAGEYDMLELRMSLLSPYVDRFLIVEGTETFSGKPKPLYWAERDDRFAEWEDKITYRVVSDHDDEGILAQIAERDYIGANSFRRAFYQKETLRRMLERLNPDDDDIVYYGDVDEVFKPKDIDDKVYKLRQIAYSYYLNNRSPEDWRGTIVTRWKNLKNGCLNDMRANPENILEGGGWHFTNLGGIDAIRRKVDSYDHTEVNIPPVTDNLEARMEDNTDFLGRGWKMWIDHSDLPIGILERRDELITKGLWKS